MEYRGPTNSFRLKSFVQFIFALITSFAAEIASSSESLAGPNEIIWRKRAMTT